jgi:hypothetical protein
MMLAQRGAIMITAALQDMFAGVLAGVPAIVTRPHRAHALNSNHPHSLISKRHVTLAPFTNTSISRAMIQSSSTPSP